MLFEDRDMATGRLVNTIISFDGKAFIVEYVNPDLSLDMECLRSGEKLERVDQDNPLLILYPPPLGYVNHKGITAYLMRKPVRRWKQGLDTQSIITHQGANVRLENSDLVDCLEGVYPGLDEALGMFKSKNPFKPEAVKSVAFSRSFAVKEVEKERVLCYKGRDVGKVEDKGPILNPKFIWLNESLQEAV